MSKFSLVLDSSQITEFLHCPRHWYYSHIRNLIPATLPDEKNEAMNAGTYGHKLLDIYYRNRFSNLTLNSNLESCFAYDPDKDTCECGCMKDVHKDIILNSTRTGSPIGMSDNAPEILNECGRCKKCLKFRPKPFPLSDDIRFQVRNRFRDYVMKYQNNDFVIQSPEHSEIGFSEPIYEDTDNYFVLEGRMDLLGTLQGLPVLVDHKWQVKTHWLYPKSVQFKNYVLISKVPTLIINYVRLVQKITPDSLYRDIVSFSKPEIQEWKNRVIEIFFYVKECIQTGDFERVWSSCGGSQLTYDKNRPNYCWYNPLCEECDPVMRERKENTLYKIKDVQWRPW